jgi:RNA polymerase sigma-70 factor
MFWGFAQGQQVNTDNTAHPATPAISAAKAVCLDIARQMLDRASVPTDWNLSAEQFQAALERSVLRRFGGRIPGSKELQSYLHSLHLVDLALACACRRGNESAWDYFVRQYRPELYRAARAIAGENGRELADSLYAELYGLHDSGGMRKSLFDYFHGRSKLTTWLRAILAQRHVDLIRRACRTTSLDHPEDNRTAGAAVTVVPADPPSSSDPERQRFLAILQATLEAVLEALAPRERLRLAYYYVDGLTLAQIGKLMGEHEATVSRKLERTRRDLRGQIDLALRKRKLSEAQLQLCYDYAREEWPFDLPLPLRAVQRATAAASPSPDAGRTG